MSKWYPQRGKEELIALTTLENVVQQLTRDFLWRRAFNFVNESELAAHLLIRLRESGSVTETAEEVGIHLAHLEWPCLAGKLIDLVIWQVGTSTQALDSWGYLDKYAKELPLLAAVQIKRGRGSPTPLVDTEKDINDLGTLYERLEKPVLYFLEWVDHDLQKNEKKKDKEKQQKYQEVQSNLKDWCSKGPNRRALVVSRDNVGFAYPKGAWLVDPLPQDAIENI